MFLSTHPKEQLLYVSGFPKKRQLFLGETLGGCFLFYQIPAPWIPMGIYCIMVTFEHMLPSRKLHLSPVRFPTSNVTKSPEDKNKSIPKTHSANGWLTGFKLLGIPYLVGKIWTNKVQTFISWPFGWVRKRWNSVYIILQRSFSRLVVGFKAEANLVLSSTSLAQNDPLEVLG